MRSLRRELDHVRAGDELAGRCLLVRGRRRVGKSRLIERFCETSGVPYVFFTASQQGSRELALFAEAAGDSSLPGRDLLTDTRPDSWDSALRLLAASLDDSAPSIVVIDEFPYLVERDPTVEATFQKQWDRLLSKKPVLLIVVGSDLAMMEALNSYGRAFFQRGTELVVTPLSPAETGKIVGARSAADAFDAHLVTGGLPLICSSWPSGAPLWEYLADALAEPTTALIVSAERTMAAEFPAETQARAVLGRIGSGERTFANIARAAGGLQAATLSRALDTLTTKRVATRDVPLSTKPSNEARYRVADPYLRFWLAFVGPRLAEIERGRSDRVLARIQRDWTTWRGRAVEPIIREAITLLSPVDGLPPADVVGGFWTRSNVPEIDIIGADRGPVAKQVAFAGTIKWLDRQPLGQSDLNRLTADLVAVPGASIATPLVGVSRSGVTAKGFAATLGPEDLLAAWQ